MTRFQIVGVDKQLDCSTSYESAKAFRRSCDLCALRNRYSDCSRCPIREAYENIHSVLVERETSKTF